MAGPMAESIAGVWADGRVGTYRGIKKGALKYSATVFGDKGVSVAGVYGHGVPVKGIVPTNDKYMGYEGIAIESAATSSSSLPSDARSRSTSPRKNGFPPVIACTVSTSGGVGDTPAARSMNRSTSGRPSPASTRRRAMVSRPRT